VEVRSEEDPKVGGPDGRPRCGRSYSWNSRGRYIRMRVPGRKWKHQAALLQTILGIVREEGGDPRRVVTEVGFPDWGLSSKGGLLRFDIYVPQWNLLVDYHGIQHYTPNNPYHRKPGQYRRQQLNDALKRDVAPLNGMNYVILSYREDVEDEAWIRRKLREVVKLK